MPTNKNSKGNGRQNPSGIRENTPTIKMDKFAKRPPSLNGINKQLP